MIKRTLYFGNPAYLSKQDLQMVIKRPSVEKCEQLPATEKKEMERTIPIEDIGIVILDNNQITITQGLLDGLIQNNCAIISCDKNHLPEGLVLPLIGHSTYNERVRTQLNASLPLKKQLWQQTIQMKIENQSSVLSSMRHVEIGNMKKWANDVKSGDPDNYEARAAVYYWKNMFPEYKDFMRDKDGEWPNNILNYGYAILRAIIARALVASGMFPLIGIHHHGKYNSYCLADDIMEPYRPYVDKMIIEIISKIPSKEQGFLTKEIKKELLSIPVIEVTIDGKRSPLMIAAGITTASLYKCFAGDCRKILYPIM